MGKSKLLLSVLLLFAAVHGQASIFMPVDVATQVDQADLIFIGTVVGEESVPVKDGTFAYTYVTFLVDETLKGAAGGPTLTLRLAGGGAISVGGVPRFRSGGRHLLFVQDNDRNPFPLVGGPQGKLDLIEHPETRELVVADAKGFLIGGLRGKEWSRGGLQIDRFGRLRRPERVAEVVSQEGVTVTLDQPRVDERIVPASRVLAALRALIQGRAFAPEFRRGAVVHSASPTNVPDTAPFSRPTNAR